MGARASWRRLLRSILGCLALAAPLTCATAADDPPVVFREARVLESASAEEPPVQAGWTTVSLPHRARKPAYPELATYWYQVTFTVPPWAQGRDAWLFFPTLLTGGKVFINGKQVNEIRGSDASHQVRWFRPFMLFVPPASLRPGANTISIRLTTREPVTSFGEFWIGPQAQLSGAYETYWFLESTSVVIACIISLVTSVLMLAFWWRRRQETTYALFGVTAMLWGLRSVIIPITDVPMAYWVEWRFLYYVTTGGFGAWLTIFLLAFCGQPLPRLRQFLLWNWLLGSLAFLIVGNPLRTMMDTFWIINVIPFLLFAVCKMASFAVRQRTPASFALVAATLLTLGLSVHDYAAHQGLFGIRQYFLLHLGIPAFLLVMALVLLDRLVDSLTQAESSNDRLAHRIAHREAELAVYYEQLHALEREQATSEERKRIMQDMHDGVGSQLLSTLVLLQRGPVGHVRVVALLQECLDDMRLAIDSLAPHDPDMLATLGNFRFRMASRFGQMGIDFMWNNIDLPDQCAIVPHASLQVLRILQEALTNVLKHANATRVDVTVRFTPEALTITVHDDGVGQTPAGHAGSASAAGKVPTTGRGLANMAQRAQKVGGSLRLLHPQTGYAVELTIPLSVGVTEAAVA